VSDAAPAGRSAADARRANRISFVGVWILRLLASTWRIRWVNREAAVARHAAGEPFLLMLWHGDMLPLLWAHRGWPVNIVISTHRDGEIIARVAERLGFSTVRGSSSQSAERALLGLARVLKGGGIGAITPDGPRGPRHSFAPGALVAAMRSGAPVIALGIDVPSAWHLKSWDRFTIPKPFARITIHCSVPTHVQSQQPRDAMVEAPAFAELMHASARAASDGR
jgi:lysophospholipid acyltransferase (LPLAT)-like uncharacterized protein